MNKKEMIKQKELIVNRKWIFVLSLFIVFNSCKNESKEDMDVVFLNSYINNYRIKKNIDSIFLAYNNSNTEIFKTYNRYLELNFEKNSTIINSVFSKKEVEYYNEQTVDTSIWDLDVINKLDNVYSEKEVTTREDLLFITKPIYTSDNKFALIYSYKKIGKKEIFFIPRIEVYQNKKEGWQKVDEIKHFQ